MKFFHEFEVKSHDIDINNMPKPSNTIRFMQEAADRNMTLSKPSYVDFFLDKKSFIMTKMAVEVYEEMNKYDQLTVQTWISATSAASSSRTYCIMKDQKMVACGISTWAVVNPDTGKIYKTKDIDFGNYEFDEPVEISLKDRIKIDKTLPFELVGTKKVLPTVTDINMHMNNTYYADMLFDYIPDALKKTMTSINIRYISEAPAGKEIKIYMIKAKQQSEEDQRADEMYYFYTTVDDQINIEAEFGVRKVR